ncbi:MAG: TetR/AcrR family transcriptional regulator [Sphingomonadales bacterium]|nr:TetR/AcrR family transcriptional regulator [Sphingomonadales bacterium]
MSSKTIDTRTRILMASWKLLEASQGRGVLMTNIAAKAGISRQALYLHFKTRAELLIATTHYIDEVNGVEERLAASRKAKTGIERLELFIEAWGNYIPEIYGVAKALLAVLDTDEEATKAWDDRMQAVREGCFAAIKAIDNDGELSPNVSVDHATDILWMLLSVRNWEQLTQQCGWSQVNYITNMKRHAHAVLVKK